MVSKLSDPTSRLTKLFALLNLKWNKLIHLELGRCKPWHKHYVEETRGWSSRKEIDQPSTGYITHSSNRNLTIKCKFDSNSFFICASVNEAFGAWGETQKLKIMNYLWELYAYRPGVCFSILGFHSTDINTSAMCNRGVPGSERKLRKWVFLRCHLFIFLPAGAYRSFIFANYIVDIGSSFSHLLSSLLENKNAMIGASLVGLRLLIERG